MSSTSTHRLDSSVSSVYFYSISISFESLAMSSTAVTASSFWSSILSFLSYPPAAASLASATSTLNRSCAVLKSSINPPNYSSDASLSSPINCLSEVSKGTSSAVCRYRSIWEETSRAAQSLPITELLAWTVVPAASLFLAYTNGKNQLWKETWDLPSAVTRGGPLDVDSRFGRYSYR